MNQKSVNNISTLAAYNILEKLKQTNSPIYHNVLERLNSKTGMSGMGGFLEDLGSSITGAIKEAPKFYFEKERQKADMKKAQEIAAFELAKADRQIQNKIIATRQMEIQDYSRVAQLQNESNRLRQIINDIELSGGQKTGLYVAGGLGLVLAFLIFRRKQA